MAPRKKQSTSIIVKNYGRHPGECFTMVPHVVMDAKNIDIKARMLWIYISSHAEGYEVRSKQIMEAMSMAVNSFRRCRKILEQHNMLRVEVKEGSNKINVRHIFHVVKDPTQWVDVELIGRSAKYNHIQNECEETTTVSISDREPYSKQMRESSVTLSETDTDKRKDLKNKKNITSPDRGGLVFDVSEEQDTEALKMLDHFYSERERLGLVSVKPKLRSEGAQEVRAIAKLCKLELSALEAVFSWIADHEFWATHTLSLMSLRNKKKGEPPKILKILAQYQSSQRAAVKEDMVLEQDAQEKLRQYAGHFSGRSGQISLSQQKRFWKWCHDNGCLSTGASVIKDKLGNGFNAFIGSKTAETDFIDALILQVENKQKQGMKPVEDDMSKYYEEPKTEEEKARRLAMIGQ